MSARGLFGSMMACHTCAHVVDDEQIGSEIILGDDEAEAPPAKSSSAGSLSPSAGSLTLPLRPEPLAVLLARAKRDCSVDTAGAQTRTTAESGGFGDLLSDPESDDPISPVHRRLDVAPASGPSPTAGHRTPASSMNSPTSSALVGMSPSARLRARFARRGRHGSTDSITSRRSIREVVHSITNAMTGKSARHAHPAEHEAMPQLVTPTKPPTASDVLADMSVSDATDAIQGDDGGCFAKFMHDCMNCNEFAFTHWASHACGTQERTMTYTMPKPKQIPDAVRKVIHVPESIVGTARTWYSVSDSGDEIIVLHRCRSQGIIYSDRFHVDYYYVLQANPAGGLTARVWVEPVWNKPLPFTHRPLARMLEKKLRAETASKFHDFISILEGIAHESSAQEESPR